MKKIVSRLLAFVLVLNCFSILQIKSVFAADDLGLTWQVDSTMKDSLEVTPKSTTTKDQVFLQWNFGNVDGSNFDNGTYKLEYNLDKDNAVQFIVEKIGTQAKVTYTVDGVPVDPTGKNYSVYNATKGAYVIPSATTFPIAAGSTNYVSYTDVEFGIVQNTGYSFKFNNRTIHFQWGKGTFNFVTDGVKQGNIYDMNLSLEVGANTYSDISTIFTGIPANTFISTPIANGGLTVVDKIYHTDIKNPGDTPQLKLTFDMPKAWDGSTYSVPTSSTPTQVVLDLRNDDDKKSIQLTIPNIFASNLTVGINANDKTITAIANPNPNDATKIDVLLSNLQPGIIFNPVTLSLSEINNPAFIADKTELDRGKVYTFPVYNLEVGDDSYQLKIKPYEGSNGYYRIKTTNAIAAQANIDSKLANSMSKWSLYQEKNSGKDYIYIPVSITPNNLRQEYYLVEFSETPFSDIPDPTQIVLYSQVLGAKGDAKDVALPIPQNLKVISTKIVSSPMGDTLVAVLKWDIAQNEILKRLYESGVKDITYKINRGLVPYDTNESEFVAVNLHLSLNSTGDVVVSFGDDGSGNVTVSESQIITETQNISGNEVAVSQVLASINVPVAQKDSGANAVIYYPNIYFIDVLGQYVPSSGDTKTTKQSLQQSLTLNDKENVDVMPAQNLKINPDSIGLNNFSIEWDNLTDATLSNYLNMMLSPLGYTIGKYSVKYNIFISEDKKMLDKLTPYAGKTNKLPADVASLVHEYQFEQTPTGNSLDMTAIDVDGKTGVDVLRENTILKINDIYQDKNTNPQKLMINGLDENQVYYMCVETVISPIEKGIDDADTSNYDPQQNRLSTLSATLSATTKVTTKIPDVSEKQPSTPTNFTKKDVGNDKVTLLWDDIASVDASKDGVIEYQLIRTTEVQLADKELESRDDFATMWSRITDTSKKAGVQTSGTDVYEFLKNDFSTAIASKDKFTYTPDSKVDQIIDKTLSPNQLYFYYLRAVRVIDGKPVAYSTWVPLSVTTVPIATPKNLVINRSVSFDKKTGTAITFDAPISDATRVGVDYDLQYSIMKDNGNWGDPVTMDPATLIASATKSNDTGFTKFTYQITGLQPGTTYNIKVRMVDRITGDVSIYSNLAQTRTDISQEDYDNKEEQNKWEDQFDKLLNELLKQPYFKTDSDTEALEIIYRPSMFDSELSKSVKGTFDLLKTGVDIGTYYLPASALLSLNQSNKGLGISNEDFQLMLSPNAINPDTSNEIKKIASQIKSKDIKDYYLKVTVSFENTYPNIDANTQLGDVCIVEMAVVGSTQGNSDFEEDLLTLLKSKITDKTMKADVSAKIKQKIADGASNEELVKYLDELVSDVELDFIKEAKAKLKKVSKNTQYIVSLERPLMITVAPQDSGTKLNGYQFISNQWILQAIKQFGERQGISVLNLGKFAFTTSTINIQGLDELNNATKIMDLISKYGLDDFFGKGYVYIDNEATLQMVAGTVARIGGAPRGADHVKWFADKGITIQQRNLYNAVSNQEAINLLMCLYETKTNTKISTIRISNYKVTSQMQLDARFKQGVQAAFEIGLCSNNELDPKAKITMREVFNMLGILATKLKL